MADDVMLDMWPSTGVDVPGGEHAQLVSLTDLGGIVQRMRAGEGTIDDRLALIDLAGEIETDAPATELAALADVLRQIAGA